MTKIQAIKRRNDIIRFIYRSKAVLTRHILEMFFKTEVMTRHYLLRLEKQKFLRSTFIYSLHNENPQTKGLMKEKVYFLGKEGFNLLRTNEPTEEGQKGFYKYKLNMKELAHDCTVTDLLIYFLKRHGSIKSYKTDFEHRREMKQRNLTIRIPDFSFEDAEGHYLLEYESLGRAHDRIRAMADDYKAYYGGYTKIVVSKESNLVKYEEIFKEKELKDYVLAVYDLETGFRIVKEA